jgi:hypothetical protein
MAPDDIPLALQPFIQVDTSLARRHGGTGLGLPLTKIFVELHGGRLEIESKLNVGTTMTVILPASTGVTPLTPATVPPEASSDAAEADQDRSFHSQLAAGEAIFEKRGA